MKTLLRPLAVSIIFLLSNAFASQCEVKVQLESAEKKRELCHVEKKHLYVSASCQNIEKCFLSKKIDLTTSPNQSPGFSLCYQIEGKPFFGKISGKKQKVPLCEKNGHIVDLENLMLAYRKQNNL